jgi:hypothetical protein
MIDEHNNDVPYDFKNIQYVIPEVSIEYFQWGSIYKGMRNTSLDTIINDVQYYGYELSSTPSA